MNVKTDLITLNISVMDRILLNFTRIVNLK